MVRSTLNDTDAAAREVLVERWRSMSTEERLAQVAQICEDVERLALIGIDQASPGLTERELRHELARRRYGAALADAAYSGEPSPR